MVIKRGQLAQTEGITLPDDTTIRAMEESEGYKYLGVLEASDMLHGQMKEKSGTNTYDALKKLPARS